MQLNRTDTSEIRREEFRGREYMVTPVRAMKAMELDKGYVPSQEVEKSAPAWNGTPITLNHPTDSRGQIVSANSPDIAEKTWLGYYFNADFEASEDALDGEAWIDIQNAREVGGAAEQVIDMLQNREPVAVSTGYYGDKLPAGEYDGEEHDEVMGNIRPDHLAMLPNSDGKCSIDDGCMAGVQAVNIADDSVSPENGQDEVLVNIRDTARTPEYSGTESVSWSAPTLTDYVNGLGYEDVSNVDDLTESQRSEIAQHSLLGTADAENFRELQLFPVVNPSNGNLNENALDAVIGGRGSQADAPESAIESAQNTARRLLNDEFDRDLDTNMADPEELGEEAAESFIDRVRTALGVNMTTRDEKIEILTNQHGFKRESLEGMGDQCLDRTFQSFNEEDGEEEEAEGQDEETETEEEQVEEQEDDPKTLADLTVDEFEAKVEQTATEAAIEAVNEQKEQEKRESLIDEIVNNSDKYEREELEAVNSVDVLRKMRDEETEPSGATADYTAQRGASANAASNEAESFPSLTVNRDE